MRKTIPLLLLTSIILLALASVATAANIKVVVDAPLNGHNAFYLKSEAPPLMENGRTMVPLRAVSEALGFKVNWESSNSVITISNNHRELKMQIGSNSATVDSKPAQLDVPPKLIGSSTYLPLRFISENMGYSVYYSSSKVKNGGAAEIFITSYSLLKDEEIAAVSSGRASFYTLPGKNGEAARLYLKAGGTTPGGVKIGDDLQTVFKAYGTPADPYRTLELYPQDWSGTLVYLSAFEPKGKNCYGYSYEIGIEKGKVKNLSLKPPM